MLRAGCARDRQQARNSAEEGKQKEGSQVHNGEEETSLRICSCSPCKEVLRAPQVL